MRLRLALLAPLLSPALLGCSDLGDPLRLVCELSVPSLDFGAVTVGGSAERTFTLRNSGTAPLAGNLALSCAHYEVVSGGGAFVLAPGEARAVTVRFAPGAAGSFGCSLDFGTGCGDIPMAGVGLDPGPGALCQVAPNSIDFGPVNVGTTSDRTFTIRSVGSSDLSMNVVSPCGSFLIFSGGGPGTIPPGDSLVVTVRFNPLTTGSFTCLIDLGPDCPDVSVIGTGSIPTTVSFAADVQPIFDTRGCVSCHGGSGGLFLGPGVSYGNLVNVPSPLYGALRVRPFDLSGSVLYGKITNSGQYGGLMPQGGVLIPQAERDRIRDWILEGALNN